LSKPSSPPLLSVRTALILLLGVLCGATVTTLTTLAEHNLTTAILAGLAATGGAIAFFHKVIGPARSSPATCCRSVHTDPAPPRPLPPPPSRKRAEQSRARN
jgi:hypothetical protein